MKLIKLSRTSGWIAGLWLFLVVFVFAQSSSPRAGDRKADFRFAILGDRTGEAFPGAYEQAWRETDDDHPDFVITLGDTIQGGVDDDAEQEWENVDQILEPYRKYKLFFVPGNHDIWSALSSALYQRHTQRPLHYSFNVKQAHFTVLDNSQSDCLSVDELNFLKSDLEANSQQPLKFIFFHRPSWLLQALMKNPNFPLHQIALQYGVRFIISGHLHEMLHFELGPVTYVSMASSGGHLRDPKTYEQGWFFQHTLVSVNGTSVDFTIKEVQPPIGKARVSKLEDWGTRNLKPAHSGKD